MDFLFCCEIIFLSWQRVCCTIFFSIQHGNASVVARETSPKLAHTHTHMSGDMKASNDWISGKIELAVVVRCLGDENSRYESSIFFIHESNTTQNKQTYRRKSTKKKRDSKWLNGPAKLFAIVVSASIETSSYTQHDSIFFALWST